MPSQFPVQVETLAGSEPQSATPHPPAIQLRIFGMLSQTSGSIPCPPFLLALHCQGV